MTDTITIHIDGHPYQVEENQPLVECAESLGHFIPTLCDYKGLMPSGTCRICTVKVNGRFQTACMLHTRDGMQIENNSEEVIDLRKAVLEMMFTEGNHICPVCEKSGNCQLQSLAYRYQLTTARFPRLYPKRFLDASAPQLLVEYNRCIQCRRCVRGIRTDNDEPFFFFENRGREVKLVIDPSRYAELTPQIAQAAADICPVGALMKKEPGYQTPIGSRYFDQSPGDLATEFSEEEQDHE